VRILTPTLASAILESKATKKAQATVRNAELKAAADAACKAKTAADSLAYPMLGMYTAQQQITAKEVAAWFSVHPDAILAHATNYPNQNLLRQILGNCAAPGSIGKHEDEDRSASEAAMDSTIHMAPLWASMVAFRQLLTIESW
jgi:hypothetical protein